MDFDINRFLQHTGTIGVVLFVSGVLDDLFKADSGQIDITLMSVGAALICLSCFRKK